MGYAPVYIFGFALSRSERLRQALLPHPAAPAAILIAVASVYAAWYAGIGDTGSGHAHAWIAVTAVIGSALCPPAATVLIVRSALAIRSVPAIVGRLSDAAFTIYLVHFPLFLLLNLGFAHVAWNTYVEYAIVLVAGGWLSFVFHTQVVCRWPWAALLLTGKPLPRASDRMAGERTTGAGFPTPASIQP